MYGVLNINSFNKRIHYSPGRTVHQMHSFQFHVLFYQHVGGKLGYEMVLFIISITKFSISWEFASGMWTVAKLILFYKVSCVLVASVMTRHIEFLFKNLINARGKFRCHVYVFSQYMGWLWTEWGPIHKGESSLVLHSIISLIRESWRLSNSHSELQFNLQFSHKII